MDVVIKTLGCKVNLYESEFIRDLIIKTGNKIVLENGEVYIINTCSVTNTSDNKSKKLIRKVRRENKDAIIVVVGCFSQNLGLKTSEVVDADIILGNKDKSKILEYIEEFKKNKEKIIKIYDTSNQEFEDMEIEKFTTKARAFVKIEDGCNNFCSYCIIPYLRGRVRSKNINTLIHEVNNLVENNHKEIVFTGIHTGQYNSDGYLLKDAIEKVLENKKLLRLRISSIEINELNNEILRYLDNNLAHHFHIPLQSGSDKILKLMNRKYDTAFFEERVNYIRSMCPDVSITTDVIVGFPGETLEDAAENYKFCEKIGFSKIHVFPYSDRDGTLASKMKNKVLETEKKERVHQLLKLSEKLSNQYMQKMIGRKETIIVEEVFENYSIGHTSNFILVKVNQKLKENQVYNIILESQEEDKMIGKIL